MANRFTKLFGAKPAAPEQHPQFHGDSNEGTGIRSVGETGLNAEDAVRFDQQSQFAGDLNEGTGIRSVGHGELEGVSLGEHQAGSIIADIPGHVGLAGEEEQSSLIGLLVPANHVVGDAPALEFHHVGFTSDDDPDIDLGDLDFMGSGDDGQSI